MNNLDFLNANPALCKYLLDSSILDIIPGGGISIATDVTCKTIVHNPAAAKIFRIEPWSNFSHSAPEPPPVKIYHHGKLLKHKEMPMQRSAWYGEEVNDYLMELVWEDGIVKILRCSSRPLVDSMKKIIGSMAVFEDITELVRIANELDLDKTHLEELIVERNSALRLSEERFSKIFLKNPQMISIIRKSDYQFVDVNNRFLKVTNCSREEVIGKTPVQLGLPERHFQRLKEALDQKGSIENIEITVPMEENHQVTLLISMDQIELNGEECILVASSDISEMKQILADIARLDRLKLVGQMAAGIGHEIRNPMTTIRGYLQLLGAKPEFQSQRSMFDIMISELDRANSIITEFLSLARDKPTEQKNQNINDILQQLYPLLEADTFTQNKQIIFKAEETPDIPLNAKEISQLVLNLCRNGLEAMPERGTLTIRTYIEAEHLVLSIQDEGCGIPAEYLDKLGIPFFTTKENGTGLGLSTCYSIANRHKAIIDVESGPGGTTFFVKFPFLAEESQETCGTIDVAVC